MQRKNSLRRRFILPAIGLCAISLTVERAAFALDGPPAPPLQGESPALPAPTAGPTDSEADFVVLESGPVHEAFAEPITLNAQPDIVVAKQPPEPIEELPPETRPHGDNVLWIPGYWAWIEEDGDFVWISGVWRDVPPGQQWVPGYWSEVEGGYRWTHGFWGPASTGQLGYLPPPPESLDAGPVSPQPGDDYFYVPGCWVWHNSRYAWRPGFWHPGQDSWVWIPAHYCWTPRGYVFLSGYWDYPLARRGLLFAPIRFYRPVYIAAGYRYTPYYWINVSRLTVGLFVSPLRGHYYFGNYYGPRYAAAGYYPWYQYHHRRFGYDPLFVYESYSHRRVGVGDRWLADLRSGYEHNAQHFADRPQGPRGFNPQDEPQLAKRRGSDADHDQTPRFVHNVKELDQGKLTRLNQQQRLQVVEQDAARLQNARRQRAATESSGLGSDAALRRGNDSDQVGRGDVPNRAALNSQDSARSAFDRSGGSERFGTNSPPSEFRSFDRSQSARSRSGEPNANPSTANPSAGNPSATSPFRTPRTEPGPGSATSRTPQPSGGPGPSSFPFSPRQERSAPQTTRNPNLPKQDFSSRNFSSPSRQIPGPAPTTRNPSFGGGTRSGSDFRASPSFRSTPQGGGGSINRGGGGSISRGGGGSINRGGGGGSISRGGGGGGSISRGGRGGR